MRISNLNEQKRATFAPFWDRAVHKDCSAQGHSILTGLLNNFSSGFLVNHCGRRYSLSHLSWDLQVFQIKRQICQLFGIVNILVQRSIHLNIGNCWITTSWDTDWIQIWIITWYLLIINYFAGHCTCHHEPLRFTP